MLTTFTISIAPLWYENLIVTDQSLLDALIKGEIIYRVNYLKPDELITPQCFKESDVVFIENLDPLVEGFEEYSIMRRSKDPKYVQGYKQQGYKESIMGSLVDLSNNNVERITTRKYMPSCNAWEALSIFASDYWFKGLRKYIFGQHLSN